MGNVFENLPLPVLNGPGDAVDVSTMGGSKTLLVDGSFSGCSITVEVSVDGGTEFAPIAAFQSGAARRSVEVAATHMRASVSGRVDGLPFSATVNVGANDQGASHAALPLPVGTGPGTSVDVSAFGLFTTIVVSGSFPRAAVLIEGSQDGTDWAPVCQFNGQGGLQSLIITANFLRTNVRGRAISGVTAAVAAIDDASGGGGGTSTSGGEAGIIGAGTIEDPAIPVAGPYRPIDRVWVFDDYFTAQPPWIVGNQGFPQLEGTGYTGILQSGKADETTNWSISRNVSSAGAADDMLGVLQLQTVGADAGGYITSSQFLTGSEDGENIPLSVIAGDFDLWYSARVAVEGRNDFPANNTLWCGFMEKLDLSVIDGFEQGFWFRIDVAGGEQRYFAKYNFGLAVGDVDTGVAVGHNPAHPFSPRGAADLIARCTRVGDTTTLRFYVNGVLLVGPINVPDVASAKAIAPLSSMRAEQNGNFQSLYVDWQCWQLTGRPR